MKTATKGDLVVLRHKGSYTLANFAGSGEYDIIELAIVARTQRAGELVSHVTKVSPDLSTFGPVPVKQLRADIITTGIPNGLAVIEAIKTTSFDSIEETREALRPFRPATTQVTQ